MDITESRHQERLFARGVFSHAPLPEWVPSNGRRFWRLNAPAYGLKDAPLALQRSLYRHLVNLEHSFAQVFSQYAVSSLGPRLFSVFGKEAGRLAPLPPVLTIFLVAGNRLFRNGRSHLRSLDWGSRNYRSPRLRTSGWKYPRGRITPCVRPRPFSRPS